MLLIGTTFIALILLIWFRTDAWLEYTKLLRLNSLSFYKDYEEKQKDDPLLTYPIFLRRYKNCFMVRLITCPICLAVWFGMWCAIFTSISMFPIYVIGGLLLFAAIDRLLG